MASYREWLALQAQKRSVPKYASYLELAEWFARNWSVFAGTSFAISVGYWFEFRRVYAIPVAFGSPSALASLPALFGIVLLCNVVLAITLLSPSMALWTRVRTNGPRLIDGHRPARKSGFINPFRTSDLSRAWLVTQIVAVAGALVAMSFMDAEFRGMRFVLGALAVTALIIGMDALRTVRRTAGIRGRDIWVSNGYVFYATVLQCLTVTCLGRIIFNPRHWSAETPVYWCWAVWAFVCLMVAMAQFFFALTFVRGWTNISARWISLLLACLPGLPLILPPIAADIAAFAYGTPDRNGKRCVRLIASHDAKASDWEGLVLPGSPSHTANLAYVAQIDGYQVKRTWGGDTVTIPAVQVKGVMSCEPEAGPNPYEAE